MAECKNCGNKYTVDEGYSDYCSGDCKIEFKRSKEDLEREKERKAKACNHCGKYIPDETVLEYCSDICKLKAKENDKG